jgi:hypothetical protein
MSERRDGIPSATHDARDTFVGPFYAWRAWRAIEQRVGDEVWWLRSVIFNDLWRPHEEQVARCRRNRLWRLLHWRSRNHHAPDECCNCGIYAAGPELLRPYLTDVGHDKQHVWVVGRIAIWGSLVECERGFKAERVYPERLYVVPSTLYGRKRAQRALEVAFSLRDYGVPVEVLSGSGDEIIAALKQIDDRQAARPAAPA